MKTFNQENLIAALILANSLEMANSGWQGTDSEVFRYELFKRVESGFYVSGEKNFKTYGNGATFSETLFYSVSSMLRKSGFLNNNESCYYEITPSGIGELDRLFRKIIETEGYMDGSYAAPTYKGADTLDRVARYDFGIYGLFPPEDEYSGDLILDPFAIFAALTQPTE